ncbi:MAG: histidine--tRNA ligase [Chloroflexi bacterium]|nr:histidine--tRNA ligase [Chloroflexota bacterium]
MFLAPRGTVDILPEDQPYWIHVYDVIRDVVRLFGYSRLDVPIFEETGLYVRGVGEGTDIVDKEMYSFVDKGGREITLRPEFTAGLVRAYIQHGMHTLPQPVKLYTTGPIFRYERVQAGRYRQHTQFDVEVLGSSDPAVDLEVMSVAWHLFSQLGFGGLAFQLNSTGCPRCRPAYIEALVHYYEGHQGEVCEDCRRRLVRNPLRLLDCKVDSCQPIINNAPHIMDYLCSECAEHLATLRGYLDGLGRAYTINHRLVRGLDYYTKTVFEVWAQGIGAQNAVCGGGRYDGLAQELGGQPTPGIGFGSGIERIVMLMKEQGIQVPGIPAPQVVLVYHGEACKARALQLLTELREQHVAATIGFDDRSLRAQLRNANRTGAPYALVLGEQELAAGEIVLQGMLADGTREALPLGGAARVVAARLGAGATCVK